MGEIFKCKDIREVINGKIVQISNQEFLRHLYNCPECVEYYKQKQVEKSWKA
jgi:hypothetical protein